jgi:hypothetical protein
MSAAASGSTASPAFSHSASPSPASPAKASTAASSAPATPGAKAEEDARKKKKEVAIRELMVSGATDEMLTKLGMYLNGEVMASAREYQLLDELHSLATQRYEVRAAGMVAAAVFLSSPSCSAIDMCTCAMCALSAASHTTKRCFHFPADDERAAGDAAGRVGGRGVQV